MKYCKDCKYYVMSASYIDLNPQCTHKESLKEINLVTGEYEYQSCQFMRHIDAKKCGFIGRLWEAKS